MCFRSGLFACCKVGQPSNLENLTSAALSRRVLRKTALAELEVLKFSAWRLGNQETDQNRNNEGDPHCRRRTKLDFVQFVFHAFLTEIEPPTVVMVRSPNRIASTLFLAITGITRFSKPGSLMVTLNTRAKSASLNAAVPCLVVGVFISASVCRLVPVLELGSALS